MLEITPNNKALSEWDKAIMSGELSEEKTKEKLIHYGYNSLTSLESLMVKKIVAKIESVNVEDVTETQLINYTKIVKSEYFKELCESKIIEGFTAGNGHFYRTNRDDQTRMMGQKDELDFNPNIATVTWKTEDIGYVLHTRDEWLTIYAQAFTHVKSHLFMYDDLKQKVLNCTTHDEITQIAWV